MVVGLYCLVVCSAMYVIYYTTWHDTNRGLPRIDADFDMHILNVSQVINFAIFLTCINILVSRNIALMRYLILKRPNK